ncbi:T9SS type A sorting domain-containing protein [Antarcticibacterium flavum]|uniref:T9SS type A sorting domain-containing protein n=2 Tax=Antarcticibacterium TaxID=2058174 RepID=A0A5B7X6G3_9FLAO|nr:LamG-like jellyroll fold domain-containing protein [Antarcticibacterium flavum]QCY70338.1 T9SS type A sorting domain-containing protein [Antarcticibacterium flavum]
MILLQPTPLEIIETTLSHPICFGGEDGNASITVAGGFIPEVTSPDYTYFVTDSNGNEIQRLENSENITFLAEGLSAGNYSFTVSIANGCSSTAVSITIINPDPININAGEDIVFDQCGILSTRLAAEPVAQGETGVWTIVEGENGNLSDTSDPSSQFTGDASTTYKLLWTITNSDGCVNSDELIVIFPEACSTLDFDGVDDHITFENNYNLNGAFTVEAWVKPHSINGVKTILSKRDSENLNSGGYDIIVNNGVPTFRINGTTLNTTHKIQTNRWYHIAGTFDGTNAKLYVDGIELNSSGVSSSIPVASPFVIGAMYKNSTPLVPINYFHGWIEEVRLWKTALTAEQLRFMMNQRLTNNNGNVRGVEIPIDIRENNKDNDNPEDDIMLSWSNLLGYYHMNKVENGYVIGERTGDIKGKLINITTLQKNSAPLPYESDSEGPWKSNATWDINSGNQDLKKWWTYPNDVGINGAPILWNIAKINHDITSGGHDINVLGLLSEGGTLKIANPSDTEDWQNSGQALRVSHYLKLNGNINLVGESQLIQTDIKTTAEITDATVEFPQSITSVLEELSKGYIVRAQQGTANSFNYNYWSSPVSLQDAANNSTYTIGGVMMDGSSTSNYGKPLSFGAWHEFADGAPATPRKISNYWLHKFRGTANVYSEWVHIGSTGTLLAGEGYTMKGTAGNAAIEDRQNYVFKGKPNNGTIALTIGTDQNYLLGNPYPSAIDVNAFILENLKDVTGGKNDKNVFNGAVYFWDHFAGKSHILLEYIGGYATRNLLDGVPAISNDQRVNANDQKSNKIPGRYIPVAQGFFINTTLDEEIAGNITIHGGDVKFKNSQRAFVRESTGNTGNALFLRPEQNSKSSEKTDDRSKIRLDFKSPMKFNRQILVGVDPNTTDGFDLGYDAPLNDNSPEDMFWMIGKREFVIQGVPDFNPDRILPLGIYTQEKGDISISINKLENIEDDFDIFLYDKEGDIYSDLRGGNYEIEIEPGYYSDRFAIVFQIKTEQELPDEGEENEEEEEEEETDKPGSGENPDQTEPEKLDPEKDYGKVDIFYLSTNQELVLKNPDLLKIESVLLYSLSGQVIEEFYNLPVQKETRLPIRSYNSAVYTVKLYTERGLVQKKIIINN